MISISKQSVLLAQDKIRMQNRGTVKQNIFHGEVCCPEAREGKTLSFF